MIAWSLTLQKSKTWVVEKVIEIVLSLMGVFAFFVLKLEPPFCELDRTCSSTCRDDDERCRSIRGRTPSLLQRMRSRFNCEPSSEMCPSRLSPCSVWHFGIVMKRFHTNIQSLSSYVNEATRCRWLSSFNSSHVLDPFTSAISAATKK